MPEPKNPELADQTARILMEDSSNAIFLLDKEKKIHFLNKRAEKFLEKSKEDLIGKYFDEVIKISAEEKGEDKKERKLIESEEYFKTWIETPNGAVYAEICTKKIKMNEEPAGTLLILKIEQKSSTYLHALEALGSAIQRHSGAQKIYETLGEELARVGIAFMAFPYKELFSVGYHNLDKKKMQVTEFIMGVPLTEIKLTLEKNAFEKMKEQKSLFFPDISSILLSATPKFDTSQLRRFFSLIGFSKGVVVPLTFKDELTGVMAFLSEEFTSEDVFALSKLGVQISVALERAAHFEWLVADLKALEEQISARTQELEKVKSQMESIVQSSVDAIMAADLEGRITFANRGVKTMLGYDETETLGQPITAYYAGGRKLAKKIRDTIMKKGQIENEELSFVAKNGRIVRTMASLSLLRNEKGTVTGIMAVLKDVTEEKRLQETLESLNEAAFRIQKSRTQEEIFAVTAEELRRFNFHVVFMLFNKQKTAGDVVYITAEKVLEVLNVQGQELPARHQISLNHPLYQNLIKKKEAAYIENLSKVIKQVLPQELHEITEKGINLLGIAGKKVIMAPLVVHDETTGLLAVISDIITGNDMPSVCAFANQVSTALENARLLAESQRRADELARNLEEQQVLQELNTKLFLAQSEDEVLDAAIEGIHKLGKSFSVVAVIDEERTHVIIVRLEIKPKLLKAIEKIARTLIPQFTLLKYQIPLAEEDNIYYQFFKNEIPLITSNVTVQYAVMRTELSQIYAGFAPKNSLLQTVIRKISQILPYESLMMFPVIVGGSATGCLTVISEEVYTEKDFVIMRTVGEMVSGAMERINRSAQLTETLNELRAVQRINTLLNMGASLDQILAHVSSSIKEVYHYQFAYPMLLDPSREYLTFEHVSLPPSAGKKLRDLVGVDLRDFRYPFIKDSYILNQVINEGKCIIVNGFEKLAEKVTIDRVSFMVKKLGPDLVRELGLDSNKVNIMMAPLPYGEDVIGVLFLGHQKSLKEEDFDHLEYFLDQVGIAIAKSEVERKLRQSLEELQELDRMKSEFIDIASHELRTPLTTLKLYLEMMAMEQYGKLSEPLKERIRVMEEGVNRLEEIINQTLVASRLIKNKLSLEKRSVSLVEIATEVIHQLRPLWKAKDQNIFVESPPDLPGLEGDRKALFTVISNLVDNAVRYSPENTEILIKFVEHPLDIECMIIDQGYGIAPEHREKIFEEFYIVPSQTEYARIDGRTGLGLFIAKGIVERHGGKIWVDSILGKGSTFHVALPKKEEQ